MTIVDPLLSHISMAGPSPTTSQALWPSFRVQLRLWPFDLSWGDGMNMKYMGVSINAWFISWKIYAEYHIISLIYIYMICLLSQCPYILPCVIEQYDVIINQFGSIWEYYNKSIRFKLRILKYNIILYSGIYIYGECNIISLIYRYIYYHYIH